MSADASSGSSLKLTRTQWLICFIATLGFLFDIYELLMLPLIAKNALLDIGGIRPGSDEFYMWVGRLFYIPAIAGGIFGLLGGWLTDRFGRRRVLTFSILLYAFAAFSAGFCTNPWQLLFFRCLVFIGVCVEFVAAVAWLAELFPDPIQREKVLGYTQAFSSVGGLSVAIVNHWLALNSEYLPAIPSLFGEINDDHAAWRYTLMSGLIPAIPLIIIRPFLPESPEWEKKRNSGSLKRPSLKELFTPQLKRTTLIATLLFAMAYGAAFGSLQQMRLILPATPQVVEASAQAKEKAMEAKKKDLAGKTMEDADRKKAIGGAGARAAKGTEQASAAKVTKVQEVGGLFGRALMALLIVIIIVRGSVSAWSFIGWTQAAVFLVYEALAGFQGTAIEHLMCLGKGLFYGGILGVPVWLIGSSIGKAFQGSPSGKVLRLYQLPGLIAMPIVFGWAITDSLNSAYIGMFIAGFLVVGQFTFWGNMLPKLFPIHLRGTGESFAANIGGRLIGTSFAWIATTLAASSIFPESLQGDEYGPTRMAYTAAGVGTFVFLVGFIATYWLPEPQFSDHGGDDKHEDEEDKKETVALDEVIEQEDAAAGADDGDEGHDR